MAGSNAPDPRMDADDLYREDTYSDRKVGTIRVMTPVKSDGTPDASRPSIFVGQAQSKSAIDLKRPMRALLSLRSRLRR